MNAGGSIVGLAAALWLATTMNAQPGAPAAERAPDLDFPTVLYGAAYYNEYMPGDQQARLVKDVALMKAAGLNVVRMSESTWSLWEATYGMRQNMDTDSPAYRFTPSG